MIGIENCTDLIWRDVLHIVEADGADGAETSLLTHRLHVSSGVAVRQRCYLLDLLIRQVIPLRPHQVFHYLASRLLQII